MKRMVVSRRLVGRVCLRGAIAAWVPMLMLGAWVSAQEATAKRSVGDGVYTDAQAERGKAAYEKDCAFCHLSDLTGQGFAPGLIEDNFKHRWQDGTVAELFAVVKATMPQDKPESLPDAHVHRHRRLPAASEQVSRRAGGTEARSRGAERNAIQRGREVGR